MTTLGILVTVFLISAAIILRGMAPWPETPHRWLAGWDLRMTNLMFRWRRRRRIRRSPLRSPRSLVTGRR